MLGDAAEVLARTLTTAAAEVSKACQDNAEAETYNRITDIADNTYNGNTPQREKASDAHTARAMPQAGAQVDAPYDPTHYYLGKLCPLGHDYQGTGQSLRRITKGDCRRCMSRTVRRARKRQGGGLR